MSSESSQLSQLLVRATTMDEGAFSRVIDVAMSRLVRLTRRMFRAYPSLRRWEETDDVCQDAVIRLYKSLKALRPQSTAEFFGLATLQVRRTLIDLGRRHFGPHGDGRRYRSDALLFIRGNDERRHLTDFSDEPRTLAEWTAFHEAARALPDDERAVFDAVYYGGMTYEQAAGLLNMTRRTAIRRMNRARLRLTRFVVSDSVNP